MAPLSILALRSVMNRRWSALLSLLAIAVSVFLFVGVEKVREGARQSFERTISGADLVVGARSGPVNLILYSIFRIGDPTGSISWKSYQEIAAMDEVAWTIPLSLGDAHRGFRVVGTENTFFDHYQYGDGETLRFAVGDRFTDLFDAVIGADVAEALGYTLGAEIVVSHGLGEHSFAHHDDKPFRVAGVLARTGTPVDRSVHVTLQGVEAMHVGWETGARSPLASIMTAERLRGISLEPDEITAIIVGLKDRSSALAVQRRINTMDAEPLLAALPALALSQLWQIVGVVERALSAVSACVVVVGLIVILVTILNGLNERRREMAILRSVGAGRFDVFALLIAEAKLLAFLGAIAGLAALYAALYALAPLVRERTGVSIDMAGPGWFDVAVVVGVTAAAALLALFPAWRNYRNSLADGLAIRL
ncbi:FtsX-like permease family protein [bacterium]|nr:FtsX-like permease family protein [bacterium]